MRILVTGGAGYIGAHVVRLLQNRGDSVVVVDDLATGYADRLEGCRLVELDLATDSATARLESILREEKIDAIIHLAARKQVAESVQRAAWYYQQNVGGLATVLAAAEAAGVHRVVFSSSAAVYGAADGAITEQSETTPINPYGETKLIGEWLMASAARSFDLAGVSLRYFNVAGAGWPDLGDRMALNLVPMVFERVDAGQSPVIFGADYDTPDGTCVRDFVHVLDLAEAHLLALDRTEGAGSSHRVYNVGTGEGTSVKQVVDEIVALSGTGLSTDVRERRPGDPPSVVASAELIAADLGWRASRGLREIVESAWTSHVARGVASPAPLAD